MRMPGTTAPTRRFTKVARLTPIQEARLNAVKIKYGVEKTIELLGVHRVQLQKLDFGGYASAGVVARVLAGLEVL